MPTNQPEKQSCCTPPRSPERASANTEHLITSSKMDKSLRDCVEIPGGAAFKGTNTPFLIQDNEAPLKKSKVRPFLCERGTVTNAQFAKFVDATGYKTEAEQFGWAFVFHQNVPGETGPTLGVEGTEWWRRVDGAYWRHPDGDNNKLPEQDHPVVQVSWQDAKAYADWAGGRLPTEVEWEHAARGGLGDVPFPWGTQEPNDTDFQPCNIWQGTFPTDNLGLDGYLATAPAISYEPNGYGLYNMVGNVWEWTADPFRIKSLKRTARDANAQAGVRKLLKGGSFLCHISYCYRYRIAARTGNTPDSCSTHTSFRVIYSK